MNCKYWRIQDSKDNWLGVILFFLSPMASIPFLIYGVYRNQYKNLVWISLTLALIALISPLFADSYIHGLQYMSYLHTTATDQFIYSMVKILFSIRFLIFLLLMEYLSNL